MRPAFESPEPITEAAFWKHLGKRECATLMSSRAYLLRANAYTVLLRFYNSYLEFFRDLLLKKDVTEVLEAYIFSEKANVGGPGIDGHPKMLNRFFAALVHPMIHAGNGLEFGILGLVAEGQ